MNHKTHLKIFSGPREDPNHEKFENFFLRRLESLALENFEIFLRENPNYNKILNFFLGARGDPNFISSLFPIPD